MKKEQRIVILVLLLAVAVILLFAVNALIPQQKHGSTNQKKPLTSTPIPTEEAEEKRQGRDQLGWHLGFLDSFQAIRFRIFI